MLDWQRLSMDTASADHFHPIALTNSAEELPYGHVLDIHATRRQSLDFRGIGDLAEVI
jgi:hypothetical protein